MEIAMAVSGDQINGILAVILSLGGAAFATAIFTGATKWRGGTQASEAKAIKNLERWGELGNRRAERATDLSDYWRSHAANCEYVIRLELGPNKIPVRPPIPPDPDRHVREKLEAEQEKSK